VVEHILLHSHVRIRILRIHSKLTFRFARNLQAILATLLPLFFFSNGGGVCSLVTVHWEKDDSETVTTLLPLVIFRVIAMTFLNYQQSSEQAVCSVSASPSPSPHQASQDEQRNWRSNSMLQASRMRMLSLPPVPVSAEIDCLLLKKQGDDEVKLSLLKDKQQRIINIIDSVLDIITDDDDFLFDGSSSTRMLQ
jgi:hypothetical protein